MNNYKIEYTCIIYCLTILDDDESWEEILVENNFVYHEAMKILIQKLESKIRMKTSESDKKQCDMYKLFLEKTQKICLK